MSFSNEKIEYQSKCINTLTWGVLKVKEDVVYRNGKVMGEITDRFQGGFKMKYKGKNQYMKDQIITIRVY